MTKVRAPELIERKGWQVRRYEKAILERRGVCPAIIAHELGIRECTVTMVQRKLGLRKCRPSDEKQRLRG